MPVLRGPEATAPPGNLKMHCYDSPLLSPPCPLPPIFPFFRERSTLAKYEPTSPGKEEGTNGGRPFAAIAVAAAADGAGPGTQGSTGVY